MSVPPRQSRLDWRGQYVAAFAVGGAVALIAAVIAWALGLNGNLVTLIVWLFVFAAALAFGRLTRRRP